MKKKLDKTYLPDQEAQGKRVMVGLSGGVNSFVAAYLLKIQKYDLVAATVIFNWDENKTDASKTFSCHLDTEKLAKIKEFCHQLGIPLHLIQASDEFKEEVVETWITSRITGRKSNQCWNCHDLRMKLINRKMSELSITHLATGHLAKIFRQESHQSVYVHTSNDESNDQSALLSRLPHDILEKLMLPLSDLQQKEIMKLAENFGLTLPHKVAGLTTCFEIPSLDESVLAKFVPVKFLKHGEVVDHEQSNLGEHQGIQKYKYAEPFSLPNQNTRKPLYLAKYSFNEKKIELQSEEYFIRSSLVLKNCIVSEETSLKEPMRGVLKVWGADYADCWIYPKNFLSVYVVLDTPMKVLEGDIAAIFKKRGKNSKVYLTGKVEYIPAPKAGPWEERNSVKVDYEVDF